MAIPAPPRSRPGAAAHAAAGVAAAAMVATLPGRTHGLGLITRELLPEFGLGKVQYGTLNLWATLLGAVFCVPAGWLVERVGVRAVLGPLLLLLGAVVLRMAAVAPGGPTLLVPGVDEATAAAAGLVPLPAELFVLVLLTRGLGQSALSVASLALVGKAAGPKPGALIGAYSFLVAVGFMAAFKGIGAAYQQPGVGWRDVWAGIGWALIGAGVLAPLVARNPRPAGDPTAVAAPGGRSLTLGEAVRTPAFWLFAAATSFYGLVTTGLALFHQLVLEERGFGRDVYFQLLAVGPLVGLAANLLAGWAATRVRLGLVLAAGAGLLAASLGAFRWLESLPQVYAFTVAYGAAGGVLTVVFFTAWPQGFGPGHVGKIQAAAQLFTVVASAVGPLTLAAGHVRFGTFAAVLGRLAVVAAAFAVAALFVRLPTREEPAR